MACIRAAAMLCVMHAGCHASLRLGVLGQGSYSCCMAVACTTLAQLLAGGWSSDSKQGSARMKMTRSAVCRWSVLGQGSNHEALVFLHGFNCCLADACKTLAQFLALANLPPHIRPFLFSWPTGSFASYITAIKNGAQSEQSQMDFVGEPC